MVIVIVSYTDDIEVAYSKSEGLWHMQIRTYTHIWNMPRVFYTFMDWTLPKPVSMISALIFLGVGAVWVPLIVGIFHLPMANPYSWIAILSAPSVAAFFGNRPVFEEKSIIQYLVSQIGYLKQSKTWADMIPGFIDGEEITSIFHSRIWSPRWTRRNR